MNTLKIDIDLLYKVNSADLEALEDARFTLESIKSADPEAYDEIINESLLLIDKALNISCSDAIERIAQKLGIQT